MGFNNTKFAEATGLFFSKQNAIFYGMMDGFPVYCKYITGRSSYMIMRLHAKTEDAADFARYLESWRQKQTGITQITFRERELIAMLAIPAKDTVNTLANHVLTIASLARQSGLLPCCMSCGRIDSFSHFVLDGDGCTLCESCRLNTEENMEEIKTKKSAEPINYAGSLLGLLLGAALLFLLTYIVLKAGYVSYLTGFVGTLTALLLMKKFGHRLTYPTAAFAIVFCLIVAVITPAAEFAGEIAEHNQTNEAKAQQIIDAYKKLDDLRADATPEEREALDAFVKERKLDSSTYDSAKLMLDHQTTWECLKDMPTLLKDQLYDDMKGELIKCILWGVLSILVGCGVLLPNMLRESYGKHTLTRLS